MGPEGRFTNVSWVLQNNIAKINNTRYDIDGETPHPHPHPPPRYLDENKNLNNMTLYI